MSKIKDYSKLNERQIKNTQNKSIKDMSYSIGKNEKQPLNQNLTIFANQVDQVIKGSFKKSNNMTVLKHTPKVLQKLGVTDNPITLTVNKLDRIMNSGGKKQGVYHGLGIENVKKIPQAIQNPLDIVKSHNNSYVLTTDLSDKKDRQIIVSIKLNGRGYIDGIQVEANALTSAYGRNNYDSWMENHKKQGNIVYDIDRGYITKKRNGIQGLQLPNESISNVDNIPQNNKTVKLDTSSNNSNM